MASEFVKSVAQRVYQSVRPAAADVEMLLGLEGEVDLRSLFEFSDWVRRVHVGADIYLRGIVEFSNYCGRGCLYCGLNRFNARLGRYRMDVEEIVAAVEAVAKAGVGTVVLQSGEDEAIDAVWIERAVRRIKGRFDIAVTLSIGERSYEDYELWRQAGADRYLLKIETSNKRLYESLHPGMSFERRLECLGYLRRLGYQVGCGNLVGLKGQTVRELAEDILFFKEADFDMIGIGPFIPHAQTDLKDADAGSALMALKVIALTRIVTRNAHLPATTALGSVGGVDHRVRALEVGANVMMPNFTPGPFRKLYEIYPGKRCVDEPVGCCVGCMKMMAESIGRHLSLARGDSLKKEKHTVISAR